MTAPERSPETNQEGGFLASHQSTEPRSWLPWIVAGAVVILSLLILIVLARHSGSEPAPSGVGMSTADPYAAHLPISGVAMSQASSFSGSKVTYIDGQIANTGNQTVAGVTVEVGFRNDLNQFALRAVMPLSLIRTRDPYVDTEPVAAAPLKPQDRKDFRLIFDTVPPDWDQAIPEIRVIAVQSR